MVRLLTGLLLAPVALQVAAVPTISLQHSAQNCRATSLALNTDTSFVLKEYLIETVVIPGSNATQLRGTLAVENPGTGDTYRLYRIPISVGGGVWSICRAGQEAPLPPQLERCQYLVERRSKTIGFRFQWYCDSEDPDHPILFDATVMGELPTEVCVTRDDSAGAAGDSVTQSCSLGDVKEVLLQVQNIYSERVSLPSY